MNKSLLFFLLFFTAFLSAQSTNKDVVAKINTILLDDGVKLVATATNTTAIYKSLRYNFTVFKTDSLNKLNKEIKKDRFTLKENESVILELVSIQDIKNDKIIILLLIYDEDQIIGKDRIAYNEDLKQKNNAIKERQDETEDNDGLELRGIVTEETKTKPGRDFYEFFFNAYTLNNINGNKIVGVFEKLSFGRTTLIEVKIEEQVIHQCIGKPDLEYLEQMAKTAIRKVSKYFVDQKKIKNDIFQY